MTSYPANAGVNREKGFEELKLKLLLASLSLIAVAVSPCFAMMEVGDVSPARAKELGIEVQAAACGPDQVHVELSFKVAGALEDYSHVQLDIKDGTKFLVSSTLKEDQSRSKAGVFVGVTVDRSLLENTSLMIVTGRIMNMVGYEVRVIDFVQAELLKPGSAESRNTALIPATNAVPLTPSITPAPPASEIHQDQPPQAAIRTTQRR